MKRSFPLLIVGLLFATFANGQSQQNANSPETKVAQTASVPAHYYKLNFVVRESSEGKVLNERKYSLGVANTGAFDRDWWSLRAGTKVPVGSNYTDVGFNVDVRSLEVDASLQLRVKADISSLPSDAGNSTLPPIRQMRIEEVVLVAVGKPTVIFLGEDPNSKHRFELEVTPVKER